jgi:hypothetical protein
VTVDEMDLVSQALDVTPWQPEAYERARARLRETGSSQAGNRRRGTLGVWGKAGIGAGIGAGIAAVAAAVAVVLAGTPAPPAAPAGPASRAQAAASPLVTLAARITADIGPLPGNATLIVRTETTGNIPPQVSYNLYADSGAFYGGGDKKSLMAAVARHENMADGIDAREVAAAGYAATGDLATARVRMANASPNALGLGLSPAARKKIWEKARAGANEILKEKGAKYRLPANPPTGKTLRGYVDNYVWNNSVNALSSGAGDPRVRAGVLRLLSTISGVTVAHSVTGGQPTLTLTAGPAVFGGSGEQVLTVNAKTGMPVKSVFPAEGNVPLDVQTFQVSRVTLAGIETGRF